MGEQSIPTEEIIDGQNKAIAVLGMRVAELTKDLERSKEYAARHVDAYHKLADKTEHVGKINSWDRVWSWFQNFEPLRDIKEKVLSDADGQIGASGLIAETIEEYVNRFGE